MYIYIYIYDAYLYAGGLLLEKVLHVAKLLLQEEILLYLCLCNQLDLMLVHGMMLAKTVIQWVCFN